MCWHNIEKTYFTNVINKADLIITQSINDNYRDVNYLSTKYIIENKKDTCKVIILDICYFTFYHFDLITKKVNNDYIRKPCDYHYKEMINCYKNNKSIKNYVCMFVNNMNLKSSTELQTIADNNFQESEKRHKHNKEKFDNKNIYFVGITEYIKNNYKDKLLFYSINHPTPYLIQFLCEKIIKITLINNTIDYDVDHLYDIQCIIYKCVSKNVNFDINNHKPLLKNIRNTKKITKIYYDVYKKLGLFK